MGKQVIPDDSIEDSAALARVKELVIEMRRYAIYHGLLIGECVAWNELKKLLGVGQDESCPSNRKAG